MSRGALLSSAVSFLRDPSTASSPLAQRIAFLESKGLTPPEIEQALATASGNAPSPQGYAAAGRAQEFERDWRDWFIMAVIGGTVGYVAVKLAKKYIIPHLQPPSESDLEAAQKALEAKYDEASEMLKSLQVSTDSIAASLDEQKATVEKDLVIVRKAVEEMRAGEAKREEEARKIKEQVDEIVSSLPNMLEKQASSQAQSLADLQTELKSLKSLLIARRPVLSTPSSSTVPTTSSVPEPAARTSSFGVRSPGIPSWQLKSAAATTAAPTTPGTMYTPPPAAVSAPLEAATPAFVPAAPAVVVEDTSASGVLVEKEDAAPAAVEEAKEVVG